MMTALTYMHALNCFVVMALALCSLNKMSGRTHHGMRVAVALLAVAGFSGAVSCLDRAPSLTELFFGIGLSLGMLADRRHGHCPCAVSALTHSRGGRMERSHGS